MSEKRCCVPGCIENGGPHSTLHMFPNPLKEIDRFNSWIMAIGGSMLTANNETIYEHHRVCQIHFQDEHCRGDDGISDLAVPTKYMPNPLSLPIQLSSPEKNVECLHPGCLPSTSNGGRAKSSSAMETDQDAGSDNSVDGTDRFDYCITHQPESPTSNVDTSSNRTPLGLMQAECVPTTLQSQDQEASSSAPDMDTGFEGPMTEDSSDSSDEDNMQREYSGTSVAYRKEALADQNLRRQLSTMRSRLDKYRDKVKKQNAMLKVAQNILSNTDVMDTLSTCPKASKLLTVMLHRDQKRESDIQEKQFAMTVYKRNPFVYKLLEISKILPTWQTIVEMEEET